ncbi:M28 family peptidase [Gramella sp. AN32]|uniref:Vacuolar membrane protease n=1 Tax=Christiangramia antarctica TaxID=2058158 RepID=A0ABW5WZC5_9FLAO|nr:M28 family peptidase [Gramella sp. AN32]MCM4155175.1 peptidase M28 [Gramella sp. AN32]
MSNRLTGLAAFLLLVFAVWLSFQFDQPNYKNNEKSPLTAFSTDRAFKHVEALAEKPHYLGTKAHSEVRNYIVNELQDLGLEVQTQEAYIMNAYGNIAKPENILARIDGSGTGDALVLMSHYDSAPHSSYGASDAGSGVATILEGIRASLQKKEAYQNDIILLFTDAEEIGLLGAELFVKDHPWAKDAKLAINFEARGSGGAPYMLLETNKKNKNLVQAFKEAKVPFPVSNSLAYSIYKMLPNDTDLTVLRKQANINGFNFAFIDDHFDYHSANDTPKNLNKETLAHQGSYFMPMLSYFKDANLNELSSEKDSIYFNLIFGEFITYPFSWIFPMLIIAIIIFLILIIYGLRRKSFRFSDVFKSFLPALLSIAGSGLAVWLLWNLCLLVYQRYSEMINGFTYNGYTYMAASVFLSLAICFFVYQKFRKKIAPAALLIGPLSLWILICTLVAIHLKGASYFIIPVYFALIQFFVMIQQKKPGRILMAILCFPAFLLLMPFIWGLPVALGLKMLFVTGILSALLFGLLTPVFAYFKRKSAFTSLSLVAFIVFMVIAHFKGGFNEERPRPDSLLYIQDLDANTANWYSYDAKPDVFTEKYFNEESEVDSNSELNIDSKYNGKFTLKAPAPMIALQVPSIKMQELPSDSSGFRKYSVKIVPNRDINRLDLYEINDTNFKDFTVNGMRSKNIDFRGNDLHMHQNRWQERLLTYYASNRDTINIEFSFEGNNSPKFMLYESAYDLIGNKNLKVPERPKGIIPKPFKLNDATILKKTFTLGE